MRPHFHWLTFHRHGVMVNHKPNPRRWHFHVLWWHEHA